MCVYGGEIKLESEFKFLEIEYSHCCIDQVETLCILFWKLVVIWASHVTNYKEAYGSIIVITWGGGGGLATPICCLGQ